VNPADAEVQERVDRLFDRFERMTDAEFMLLSTVWEEQDQAARQDAWTMVKVALRATKRDNLIADARNRIASWVNNYTAQMAIGEVPGNFISSGMDPGSIRRAAIPAMLDAIAATITHDELSQDDRWVLSKPIDALAR
jgi:hypothetical protein